MSDSARLPTGPASTASFIGVLNACALACAVVDAASSSSIVLTPNQETVCAVNQDGGSISLWNWRQSSDMREVAVGAEPRTLAVAPDGRSVYVTTQRGQTLAIVDLTTARQIAEVALPGQPVGVVLSRDGRHAFVTLFAGDYLDGVYAPGVVAVVDLVTRAVIRRIAVKPFPFALALDNSGNRLCVTHFFAHQNTGIVSVIDAKNLELESEILLREDDDVAGGSGGVFTAISGIAIHPKAPRALAVGVHANIGRGSRQSGRPLSHKTTMQAVARLLDLDKGQEVPRSRIVSSFSGQAVAMPSAVTFLPSGEHFIDVYAVSRDFKVISYNERGVVAERALVALPPGPTGIALTRDGQTAFFNCRWARSIAQVAIDDVRHPQLIREIRKAPEPWDAARALGARVFHDSRDARMTPNRWLACGCCHLDGGVLSDNLVWEFTEPQKPSSPRLVNTKPLSLTGWSGPPLLIQGTYHSVQEEEKFIRSFLGGTGFLEETTPSPEYEGRSAELDGLAAFVLALRPRPNPHMQGSLPRAEILESARRGRLLFTSRRVGCGRCHRGDHLTLSGSSSAGRTFNVGTGIRADIPSLQGLWASAPYLHDGRARTLRDVLTTHNPTDRHGRTSRLTDGELDDLVHYLLAPFDEAAAP